MLPQQSTRAPASRRFFSNARCSPSAHLHPTHATPVAAAPASAATAAATSPHRTPAVAARCSYLKPRSAGQEPSDGGQEGAHQAALQGVPE
jgi:hypothetical protein